MIVGNIVNCGDEVETKFFNCLTIEEFISMYNTDDDGIKLPTLIVGWDIVKTHFEGTSILSKIITHEKGGIYWTFSRTEKRGIYEENIKEFKEKCYVDLIKNLKIYNIDPIIYKINSIDELCSKLINLSGGIGYLFQDRIVYIYKDNNIHMVDLELIEFIGFNKDVLIRFLMDNLSVFGDDFEENYTEELKHLDIKYVPYLKFKDAI